MNPLIQFKRATPLFLVAFALVCFSLSLTVQAVTPAPDGGYPNKNTAEGDSALFSLTSGFTNTAIGFNALHLNTTGFGNTATGDEALLSNTTGFNNTATGIAALVSNTTGYWNTAIGYDALPQNTTGATNMAIGPQALLSNTTGGRNTATGIFTLGHNTTGNDNTAYGLLALSNNTTGCNNIALGEEAGTNLTTGDNNIAIGNLGVAGESNTIRIGNEVAVNPPPFDGLPHAAHTATFIAGIYHVTVAKGVRVVVDSHGHLGTKASSERFKDQIKPMDKASEAILALKPVTFHYKKELDPEGGQQFGLVAEDVEKVNPDLIIRDRDGKPYTVRDDAVNAMLLNEFLKEHRTVQGQQKEIDALKAELKEQKALIQKVSAQIEVTNPAPQTVLNNQ